MTRERLAVIAIVLTGGLALGAVGSTPAEARGYVSFGFGVPLAPYYYPPPVVYAPPAYYMPPPVVVAAPPPQPVYQSQPGAATTWYYCDNPKGYYPYVSSCAAGWRQVPAQPPASR
jgi:hypothetical protein